MAKENAPHASCRVRQARWSMKNLDDMTVRDLERFVDSLLSGKANKIRPSSGKKKKAKKKKVKRRKRDDC